MDGWTALAEEVLARRSAASARVAVGITGSVAVGKTSATDAIRERLGAADPGASITSFCTDGFLRTNAEIDLAGLTLRKGFPETYRVEAIRGALVDLREGQPTDVPVYSHLTYDVVGETERVTPGDILLVEGLHLARFARDLLDLIIHLEAPATVLERWYLDRLLVLVRAAASEPTSFYAPFVGFAEEEILDIGRAWWRGINLVNLHEEIEPWRTSADLLVELAPDHSVAGIRPQHP